MRYRDTGEVHKDFHLGTMTTIRYVKKTYGMDFLTELFRRTAQQVYRAIYEELKRGDPEPLVEHWEYYFTREDGRFEVVRGAGEIVFRVLECPAYRHLTERGAEIDDDFYLQITLLNDAWSEDTPFTIRTRVTGPGAYELTIGEKHATE